MTIQTRSIGRGRDAVWIRPLGAGNVPKVIEIQANASFARLTLREARQLWECLGDTISELERADDNSPSTIP